ncbi:MAG: isochorismatase family protein [Hyphomonadaceae bacterium]|nr:isochorismatase family protein [Hyphomonadaceae bacterium]
MTQYSSPASASPLIHPTACTLFLLAPTAQDLTSMSRRARTNVRRNFVRIITAANVVGVPPLIYSRCDYAAKHGFATHVTGLALREFPGGVRGLPWQHAPLTGALSENDRPVLVVAGFWLEHEVVATALHALADSYDVYFVLDASPAKMQAAVRLSQDRLIQAGATPVVVSQVIHEWSLGTTDAAKAAALNALLLSRSTPGED